jgi:hypothetical protein
MVSLLPPASSIALKEWAVTCNALRDGEQIVILRKGGIHKDDKNFSAEFGNYPEFLLFPTYLHQARDLVKPAFHDRLDRSIEEDDIPGLTTLSAFALVTDRIEVNDPETLSRISEFHIWTDDYAEKRLHWRPKQPLTVALVRAYPLIQPQALPLLDEYGGCKSWVELGQDVPMGELSPAIADAEYERTSAAIKERLS